jgi:hypothetical protein
MSSSHNARLVFRPMQRCITAISRIRENQDDAETGVGRWILYGAAPRRSSTAERSAKAAAKHVRDTNYTTFSQLGIAMLRPKHARRSQKQCQ